MTSQSPRIAIGPSASNRKAPQKQPPVSIAKR